MEYEWAEEDVLELINLYEVNPCLYNPQDEKYRDRVVKKQCEKEIAEKLQKPGK